MNEKEKLPRRKYTDPLHEFKPVAPMPPNTLTNADGTPYQAGYDEEIKDKRLHELIEALKAARQTLSYIQEKAPGYDWNADPLYLTLKTGETFAQIDAALNNISSQ